MNPRMMDGWMDLQKTMASDESPLDFGFRFWHENLSVIKGGTLTKAHNHLAPVINMLPTGGSKLCLLLPPNLQNARRKMKNDGSQKGLGAMMQAAEEFDTPITLAYITASQGLFFPGGYWHLFFTTPSFFYTHTMTISAYVMPFRKGGGDMIQVDRQTL